MILYYLSAAGNSLHAAKYLAARFTGAGEAVRLIDMAEALRNGELQPEGTVGLVMPLHYFGVPLLAEEFLTRMDWHRTDYRFVVMTCGSHYMSNAFHQLTASLAARGTVLDAAFYVDMLSIYLPLGDIPPAAKRERQLQKADVRLAWIAGQLQQRVRKQDREYLNLVSRLIHDYTRRHRSELDANFTVGEDCIGCGRCAAVCPAANIRLEDGRPVWQHRCTQCLGCLHICPQKTIELGQKTKGRQRYRHPQISVEELLHR